VRKYRFIFRTKNKPKEVGVSDVKTVFMLFIHEFCVGGYDSLLIEKLEETRK
jgi:hypothetical protein